MLKRHYVLLVSLCIPLLISSCTKTAVEPDPLQILTSKVWQMNEIRYLQNNTSYYYKRGSSGNNVNFDDAIIKFNTDGTGTTNWQNNSVSLTWSFVNGDKSKLACTLSSGSVRLINWDNIAYTESLITYTESYVSNGVNTLAQASRTPR